MTNPVHLPPEAEAIAAAMLQLSRRLNEQLKPSDQLENVGHDAALEMRLDVMAASSDAKEVAEGIATGDVILTETPLYGRGLVVENSLVVDALSQFGNTPEGAAFGSQLLQQTAHRLATGDVSLVDPEYMQLMPLQHDDPDSSTAIDLQTGVDGQAVQPEACKELNAAQTAYHVSRAMFPNRADQSRPTRPLPMAHTPDGQGHRQGGELER